MSQQTTDYEDPFEGIPDDELSADELAERRRARANANGYQHRQESRKLREFEAKLAEAEKKLATYERRDALDTAIGDLNAEGPIKAFLRTYDGEPTADAIREAVAKDPDFSALVKFAPDPRDLAAAEQSGNAVKLASGESPVAGQLTAESIKNWPRDRKEAFRTEHKVLWDALLSNPDTPVAAPAGWA